MLENVQRKFQANLDPIGNSLTKSMYMAGLNQLFDIPGGNYVRVYKMDQICAIKLIKKQLNFCTEPFRAETTISNNYRSSPKRFRNSVAYNQGLVKSTTLMYFHHAIDISKRDVYLNFPRLSICSFPTEVTST